MAAIHEDQVVTLAEANTIADGTAVKTIGNKTFEYIKKYVDGIITVDDYELMDAFLLLVVTLNSTSEKRAKFLNWL